jgi:hypothetical protein
VLGINFLDRLLTVAKEARYLAKRDSVHCHSSRRCVTKDMGNHISETRPTDGRLEAFTNRCYRLPLPLEDVWDKYCLASSTQD